MVNVVSAILTQTMMTKYKTIVVDPPWKYGVWGKGSYKMYEKGYTDHTGRPRPLPYPHMSIDEIKKLPIDKISDDNCELYLWTTQKYLPVSFEIINFWKFKYCTTLTWCKAPKGTGQGGVFCPTTEFIIHARRGKMPKVTRVDTTWWLTKRPNNNHSKKPDFFQDLIETVTEEPRLEMFARRERKGWDVWGNEVENSIILGTDRQT